MRMSPASHGHRPTPAAIGEGPPHTVRRRTAVAGAAVSLVLAFILSIGITPGPAYAATTVSGCTIVSHPTATEFTSCPGADLSAVDLSGVNLSFADLAGANLVGANLSSARLNHADLSNVSLGSCSFLVPPIGDLTCQIATLSRANLSSVNLTAALPRYWSVALNDTRNISSGGATINSGVALTYRDDCFSMTTSVTQSGISIGDVTPGVTVLLTFVFKNLGELDLHALSVGGNSQ